MVGSGEEISQKYAFGNKKIRAAYAESKDCSDYTVIPDNPLQINRHSILSSVKLMAEA